MPKSIAFIIHGGLRSKASLKEKFARAFSGRYDVGFLETTYPGEAVVLAERAVEQRIDYLIAVGGDGTVHELVNGYMKVNEKNGCRPILGVYPCGRGNDFARTIGIRKDVVQLAELIDGHGRRPMDLGEVRYLSRSGGSEHRYFVNMADLGIGGEVVQRVRRGNLLFGSRWLYRKAIVRSLLSYRPTSVRLSSESFQWEGSIMSLCLAKGRYFGCGMCIAPQADVSSGLIQLVIVGRVGLWDYLRNIGKIRREQTLDHPEVRYAAVRSCRIEPLEGDCPLEVDGEFVGYAPVELQVREGIVDFLWKR